MVGDDFQTDWRMEFGGDGLGMIERMSRLVGLKGPNISFGW